MGRKKAMLLGAAALLCSVLGAGSRSAAEPASHPGAQEYELETDMTEFEGDLEDITA